MRIGILSADKTLFSTKRLYGAGVERGHEMYIIDYLRCYMNITSAKPSIHYGDQSFDRLDAIIPRIGAKRTFYGTAIVRQFETSGTQSINSSLAITRSRDKLRCLQLLAMKGIDMPVTGFANSLNDVGDLIRLVSGPPLIIKLIEGTQGVGVVLAETKLAAESVIQAFMGANVNIIVQEYIAEARGADVRCFVVGDKVVAAMKRQGVEGDFRSNLHQGGKGEAVKLSKEEKRIAIAATKVMGLGCAGVDLLRSNRGPLVMEINSSPGLEGIEAVTGIDVAGKIIEHIEKTHKVLGPKSRYQG